MIDKGIASYLGNLMTSDPTPTNLIGIYDETGITGNIFTGVLPASETLTISILSTGGLPPEFNTDIDNLTFQFYVKGVSEDSEGPKNTSWLIYENLKNQYQLELPDDSLLINCTALNPPRFLKVNETGQYIYTFNIQVCSLNNKWRQ